MSKDALKVFSFESSRFSESCFSVSRGVISSSAVSIGNKYFEQTFRLKVCRFSSLQQKPDGPKFPKVSMNFGLSRCSNSIFSEFSGSICCIKISIEIFWSCHKSIDWKVVGFFVASETWLYQSSKNWFSYWVDWNCKLDIMRSYTFGFSHQRVSRKLYDCREGFDWEVFKLILVLKYWCPKTHWKLSILNHLDFQNHVSPLVEAWFFPSRSQSKRFSFEQTFRLERSRYSSLQQKPEGPKVPKVSMNFSLSRYPNSIFSEFSGSNCSIKTSIDIFRVVTNQSIRSNQSVWFLPSTCQSKAL